MLSDLKFALRSLLKSPGFVAISLLTLSLGIGMNTSMFTMINFFVLRPLPYPDRDHLVRVYRTTPQIQTGQHSIPSYIELARDYPVFTSLAAYRPWQYTLTEPGRPAQNLNAIRVTGNFFQTIGLRPELGRMFTADDDLPGNHVVMLSHEEWMANFGGDPAVVGRTIKIDGEPTTIIGVTSEKFTSLFLWGPTDVFRPLAFTDKDKQDQGSTVLQLVARMDPALSLEQMNARLRSLASQVAEHRAREYKDDGLKAVTLQSTVSNKTTISILGLLVCVSGFVLLIVCANLANLLLARAFARKREYAICAALGASRGKLLRPLLAESLLLSLVGGLGGVLVAMWANDWMSGILSAQIPTAINLSLDWKVLTFAVLVSAATGLMFGIVPAWLMSRADVNDALKSGSRGSTSDRTQHRFRNSLIVGQFALALMLLAGAGFFIRGLNRMVGVDFGWTSRGLVRCVLNIPETRYDTFDKTYSFYSRLQERLTQLPGVTNATVGWTLPEFQFLSSRSYVVEGRDPPPPGHEPVAAFNGVMPTYLDTLGIKLVSGRTFTSADTRTSPSVVIINETMAHSLFPHESAVGRRIGSLDPKNRAWAEIVGVMADVKPAAGFAPPFPDFVVFGPLSQQTWNYESVTVRCDNPEAVAEPMRHAIEAIDPNIPIQQLMTVDEFVQTSSGGLTLVSQLMGGFAVLGLFLAALGVYGVIARLVALRTPELGIRMALGAQVRDVLWLMLSSGMRLVLWGAAFGLFGAFGFYKLISSISPRMSSGGELEITALVTAILVAVAMFACYIPARRATKIDPVLALRHD